MKKIVQYQPEILYLGILTRRPIENGHNVVLSTLTYSQTVPHPCGWTSHRKFPAEIRNWNLRSIRVCFFVFVLFLIQ
jgi:hypothetical protein